jgi:hypothetical protein
LHCGRENSETVAAEEEEEEETFTRAPRYWGTRNKNGQMILQMEKTL